MKSTELLESTVRLLYEACVEHFSLTRRELDGQPVIAYAIYCTSGCRNFGVAIGTPDDLRLRAPDESPGVQIAAAEWGCIHRNHQVFERLDEYVDDLYQIFYEGELEDARLDDMNSDQLWDFIAGFLVEAVVTVIEELKATGFFTDPAFSDDLLLGLQFSDPDAHGFRMMEQVSSRVNSPRWHGLMSEYCQRGLGQGQLG